MSEEKKDIVTETEQNYIDTIKTLKETTVSRDKFDKLVAENKQLLDSLVSGKEISTETPETKPSVDDLRQRLFGEDLNNLEYMQTALSLRQALMDNGEMDPFVGRGEKLVPDQSDFEAAERCAKVFQECIDYAQGDSEVFTNELMRRTIDVGLPKRK